MNSAPAANPPASTHAATAFWWRVLPDELVELDLTELRLEPAVQATLHQRGLRRLGDLLQLSLADANSLQAFSTEHLDDIRSALSQQLQAGLAGPGTAAPAAPTWAEALAQLSSALEPAQRPWLAHWLGLHGSKETLPTGWLNTTTSESGLQRTIQQRCPQLLQRLQLALAAEIRAQDGVVRTEHLATASLLQNWSAAAAHPAAPLRLCALCFPGSCSYRNNVLYALPTGELRQLRVMLQQRVVPARLPLQLDALLQELPQEHAQQHRGIVIDLLRRELRLGIAWGEVGDERIVQDPSSPIRRLAAVMAELSLPVAFEELCYAYRERYRSANRQALQRRLRRDPTFLQLGPESWTLRERHRGELAAVAPIADAVARAVCKQGGRNDLIALSRAHSDDPHLPWLVQSLLAKDPRVRLLGRGDACPANHSRSQVLEQLLVDFRRAGGDVVLGRFVANQPPHRRRLVAHLLRENQLFVSPGADRVDVLTNYPFNAERLSRIRQHVEELLDAAGGCIRINHIKASLDRTELGGGWLQPHLLMDLLRRQGPYEILPGDMVALRALHLPDNWLRCVRRLLREAGKSLSLGEIMLRRPELQPYAECLAQLLQSDPQIQCEAGHRFRLG